MENSSRSPSYEKESVDKILEATKSEYDHQYEISQKLDAKINIALALCGAIIAIWAGVLDVKKSLPALPITEYTQLILPIGYILLCIIGCTCFLIALIFLIVLVMPTKYETLNETKLIDRKLYNASPDKTGMSICAYYIKAISFNQEKNYQRSKKYSRCIILLSISIIILFILYLMNNFV